MATEGFVGQLRRKASGFDIIDCKRSSKDIFERSLLERTEVYFESKKYIATVTDVSTESNVTSFYDVERKLVNKYGMYTKRYVYGGDTFTWCWGGCNKVVVMEDPKTLKGYWASTPDNESRFTVAYSVDFMNKNTFQVEHRLDSKYSKAWKKEL